MTRGRRLPCVVPGCRRTAPWTEDDAEDGVICGRHWACVPTATKRRRRQIAAAVRKLDAVFNRQGERFTPEQFGRAQKVIRMGERCWSLAKKQAIAAAAGI